MQRVTEADLMEILAVIRPETFASGLVETLELRLAREAREADDAAAQARAEAADRREVARRCLVSCQVPAKIAALLAHGRVTDTFAVAAVRAWWQQQARRVLVLAGDPDASKTTAACVAIELDLRRWVADPRSRPGLGPRLLQAEHLITAWLFRGREAAVETVTQTNRAILLTCSLLVIDDVGQEPGELVTIFGEALDTLITTRCNKGLRTVVTANITSASALLERYGARGQRIGERLTEHGVWRTCPIVGLRRARGGAEPAGERPHMPTVGPPEDAVDEARRGHARAELAEERRLFEQGQKT